MGLRNKRAKGGRMTIMNIDESILSKLTDEQKKKVEARNPRKNSLPLLKKRVINCPQTNWKQ